MSTAGKVLIVLFLLASLIWIALAAGVAQVNTNYNTRLHELNVQVDKLAADLDQTRRDVASLNDQISQTQEEMDRQRALLRITQSDLERERSEIQETLLRSQYQLASVEETIKSSQAALDHRNTELQEGNAALAQAKTDVQALIAECSQLTNRLTSLRNDFQKTYHENVEILGKLGRSQDGQRASAN
jgi:chromosome segregation ATPase